MPEGAEVDLPVPHWSERGEWEPIDERSGERVAWPAGLDPAALPRPRYRLRERVSFLWRGRRRRGEIRDIRLTGSPPALEYILYTSGHGYWVAEEQLD